MCASGEKGRDKYLEKHDLSRPEDYEGFGKILDLQSYIDSCCFQTYLANMDYKEKWNNYFWHTSEWENDGYGDTRWRMGLIDMDLRWKESAYSAQMEHLWEIDPFTVYGTWQKDVKAITEWPIFSALRKNADFCRQFALTYMDLINTAFVPEHVLAILEDIGETDEGILDFFRYRPEYAAAAMAKEFGLTGNRVPVILEISDPAAGEIRLNTIVPDLTQGSWSGEYYTDYPIRLMAREREGWTFSHWELNGEQAGTDAEKEIKPGEDGMTLRAVFTETAGQRQEGDERE